VDPQAQVEVSLAHKRVLVRSGLSQQQIAEAIRDAGYTPRFGAQVLSRIFDLRICRAQW
jgi:hypothetical protein